MTRKKKKKQTKRDKLLLETSVQIDKFLQNSTARLLKKLSVEKECFSSFFVLYEFKSGLIRNLIEFYLLVKIYNTPAEAIASWSKKFAKRELKNKIILESLMAKIFDSIQTSDQKTYLAQTEAVIFHLLSNFNTDLRGIVGSFGSDEIVKFKILDSSDYKNFLEKYKSRKCIPLDKFWSKHSAELNKLLSSKVAYKKTDNFKKLYAKLEEVRKNFNNSNKYPINKGLGDAVIAVDCPISFIVTTLDTSFEVLCPALGKNYLILKP